eukprot:2229306-Prymnesium_polylepis.1
MTRKGQGHASRARGRRVSGAQGRAGSRRSWQRGSHDSLRKLHLERGEDGEVGGPEGADGGLDDVRVLDRHHRHRDLPLEQLVGRDLIDVRDAVAVSVLVVVVLGCLEHLLARLVEHEDVRVGALPAHLAEALDRRKHHQVLPAEEAEREAEDDEQRVFRQHIVEIPAPLEDVLVDGKDQQAALDEEGDHRLRRLHARRQLRVVLLGRERGRGLDALVDALVVAQPLVARLGGLLGRAKEVRRGRQAQLLVHEAGRRLLGGRLAHHRGVGGDAAFARMRTLLKNAAATSPHVRLGA